jgi:hypothetical protein
VHAESATGSVEDVDVPPGFAPADRMDRRPLNDWKTRYPDKLAQRAIGIEALYLSLHLMTVPVVLFLVWNGTVGDWLAVEPARHAVLARSLYAWIGGMLGGTIFSVKWLYHSVAKNIWNLDRGLWRFFTPHLSAGLSFAFTALVAADLIPLIDLRQTASPAATLGVAFLVGYFSDNATAALARLADRVFGEPHPPISNSRSDEANGMRL